MKKFIILVLSFLLVLTLCSCEIPTHGGSSATGSNGEDVDPTPTPSPMLDSVLKTVGDLAAADYNQITVTVKTLQNNLTLSDEYVITYGSLFDTVAYSVTQANKITVDNGNIVFPEAPYTVKTGSVKVNKDGTVEKLSGDDVDVDFSGIAKASFGFSKSNFSDLAFSETSLKGKVVNAKNFFNNQNLSVTDCSIDVVYGATALNTIKIDYVNANGGSQTITYSFKK